MPPTSLLPGYEIFETLQDSDITVVYRAVRQRDQQPVIIKALKVEYPSVELITRLKQEYRIPQQLNHPGIVKALSLENHQNHFAIILEDFDGVSLKQLLQSDKLSLIACLEIALQLADIIGAVHRQGIIHKDIKPSNIVINRLKQQVKLTDFGIASQLSQEMASLKSWEALEGTLLYMSPEQTGRMNRVIDYRSDYYSLGVTLYELLTGSLPFQSNDPLELIHCHIAKTPADPSLVNPHIPAAVSGIVMKLLAKTAEDRYQTVEGLRADLQHCLDQLHSHGEIADFTPGELDAASQLVMPQRLYGRTNEIDIFMQAFDRICRDTIEIVMVSGYSGIGKSSIVREIYKPITRQRGYFIAGKFDQLNRNVPYSALAQAFQQLIQQVLVEDQNQIQHWQQQLSAALATQAQVLIEVIPDLELLIGAQPAVPELTAAAAQLRFNQVLQTFIQVFAQPAHPLVLFLDDLQWADLASLQALESLITSGEQGNLMVIGAYRDNEVSSSHPVMTLIQSIQSVGLSLTAIQLQPLTVDHVCEWLSDTLHQPCDRISSLAELLHSKTQGNPFFLTQLLKTLYQDGLLYFEFKHRCWQWNLDHIQAVGIIDQSVVDLVADNIQRLPPETQRLLKLAACIGNTFSLEVLALIHQQPPEETASQLWAALQAGLVLPTSNAYKSVMLNQNLSIEKPAAVQETFNDGQRLHPAQPAVTYRFLHDRVQQAAYSLIPEADKQTTHLHIGRLLKQCNQTETRLLDIVNQLNRGAALITDAVEQLSLVRLNLAAGQKARHALAYTVALDCLKQGMALLPPDSWQQHYDLTLSLYEATIGVAFLNHQFEQAHVLASTALQQAQTVLDQVRIYDLQVQFYLAQNEMSAAIAKAQQVMDLLEIELCDRSLEQLDPAALQSLPELTDPYKLAALKVLSSVVDAAAGTPAIFQQIVLTMVRLCVEYGNSRYSAYAYGVYSWLLCGELDNPDLGYQFGQLSLAMLENYGAGELHCKVMEIFNAFVCHWREPLRRTLSPLQEDIQRCLVVSNQDYACFAAMHLACALFLVGEPLTEVAQQQQVYAEMSTKMQRPLQLTYTQVWQQVTANLNTAVEHPTRLVGDYFDEDTMLPQLIAENGSFSIFALCVAKIWLAVLFRDYEQAMANVQLAQQHEIKAGLPTTVEFNVYRSLALLGNCDRSSEAERQAYLEQVEGYQHQLQRWAELAPANYQHQHTLVAAELAYRKKDILAAMEFYDVAIDQARHSGYLQHEALAYELAGEFYQQLGRFEIARTYLINAYYRYVQWDAIAKINDLEERYPDLLLNLNSGEVGSLIRRTQTRTTTSGSSSKRGQELDLVTVLKAAQALSSEIRLDKLLPNLVTITVESLGAQQGAFLTCPDNHWHIEASGRLIDNAVQASAPAAATATPALPEQFPLQLLDYVKRIRRPLVLDDVRLDVRFNPDPYIVAQQPQSILCFPIVRHQTLIGLLYFENNLVTGAFTRDRLELLKILATQIAISLENAHLYQQAQDTIQQLQQAQLQLVQSEKMSALGNLVAGVAHEINNPVGYLAGNIEPAKGYVQDLFGLLELYQQEYPEPTTTIQDEIEDIDLEFLQEDLPKLIDSMHLGVERIRNISTSLRTFSRADKDYKVPFNLHEGIDSTILILKHRLKAQDYRPAIQVIKNYGNVPPIQCFPGQLNQVFMNLIANAIDALDEISLNQDFKELEANPNQITITTTQVDDQHIEIQIADNGSGIPEDVQSHIFEHLFTTKGVGKGTGLGLAIARQIVVDKHGGTISVASQLDRGTAFIIRLPISDSNSSPDTQTELIK